MEILILFLVSYSSSPLKKYELRLAASDNLKENYTTVVIHVKDVNDNPPVFERPTYRTQITEEDDRNLPKRVLQVLEKHKIFAKNISIRDYDFNIDITNRYELVIFFCVLVFLFLMFNFLSMRPFFCVCFEFFQF